ncbi:MAG TPA: PfkB family carbohydrate kinase [Paracoccus sp. (in: a-proteobacteria)]|uniref:PfkB family carbohydrate kinase n=1 Tax=uncultured Paracoccus sp. TaxID=189685 RepID=UPI002635383D|nr:PfkB family carbohydrate kinase [uncultured Paracoccus sp.]HMQ41037.1 PfkB family carbohydrate kinase [Paracoccus sp. (in: a-proteobacteria)]
MTALPPGWTRKDPTVICLGLTAMDHIWSVEQLPDSAGKSRAAGFASGGGGMAATAAVAIARLGGRARFWGRAGQDAAGLAMQRELADEGVDIAGFRLFEGARSSVSGVLVDPAGERTIVNFRGANLPVDAGWLPLEQIEQAGAVLADPRWVEGAAALFSAARRARVPTVLDADVAERDIFEALLPLTDHAIFSEQALTAFAGKDGLARVAEFGCTIAAVTRGSDGIDWIESGALHHLPAFSVTVIDTNGAGDVFHGAWAMAIAAGADSAAAAGFASAAAALKCAHGNGRAGIPDFAQTLDLWRPKT